MTKNIIFVLMFLLCLVSVSDSLGKHVETPVFQLSKIDIEEPCKTLDGVAKSAIEFYKTNLQDKSYLKMTSEEKNHWRDCLLIILVYQDKWRYESAGAFFKSGSNDLKNYGRGPMFNKSNILEDTLREWNVPIDIPSDYQLLDNLKELELSKDAKRTLKEWADAYGQVHPVGDIELVEKCIQQRKHYRKVLFNNYYDEMEEILWDFSEQVEEMPFDEGKEKFRNWIFESAKLLNEILIYHAYQKDFNLIKEYLEDKRGKLLSSPEHHEDLFLRITQAEKLLHICKDLMGDKKPCAASGYSELVDECRKKYEKLSDEKKTCLRHVKFCQQRSLALFLQNQLSNPIIREIGVRENLDCSELELLHKLEDRELEKIIANYLENKETLKGLSKEEEREFNEIFKALEKSFTNFPYVVVSHYARKCLERNDETTSSKLFELSEEIKLSQAVENSDEARNIVKEKLRKLVDGKRGADKVRDRMWIEQVSNLPDRVVDNNEKYPIRNLENLEKYVLELVEHYEQIKKRETKRFWQ